MQIINTSNPEWETLLQEALQQSKMVVLTEVDNPEIDQLKRKYGQDYEILSTPILGQAAQIVGGRIHGGIQKVTIRPRS